MTYVIGIDTGGTYTDAVLMDHSRPKGKQIVGKSKEITWHNQLEVSIGNCIEKLNMTREQLDSIEKVVLSTTLATNAIVEGNLHKVGLILIGERPRGELATESVKVVAGTVNIKGRITSSVDETEIQEAVRELGKDVGAIAVSGALSVRNPLLEQETKKIISDHTGLPVICGHEIARDLGFLERTNTAIINGGLLPIIRDFTEAITAVLKRFAITAPVFLVRGDGSITKMEAINEKPIDTVLSGPAASMIGAIHLTGIENAVVSDMGGTTTDTGIIKDKHVELSPEGTTIGNWKIRVKTAKLYTFGLGGDSSIRISGGKIKIGPRRALPACRGGVGVTPTDILHYTGEFIQWRQSDAVTIINKQAEENGMDPEAYVQRASKEICRVIKENNPLLKSSPGIPVCAIGAPSKIWYGKVKKIYEWDLIVPDHYEVANAVGAATAEIEEVAEATIRIGEDGLGYLAHTGTGRLTFCSKEEALVETVKVLKGQLNHLFNNQKLGVESIRVHCEDIYEGEDHLACDEIVMNEKGEILSDKKENSGKYLETCMRVVAKGRLIAGMEQSQRNSY